MKKSRSKVLSKLEAVHACSGVRSDVKMITDSMVSKADLANTLADELAKSDHTRRLDNLSARLDVLPAWTCLRRSAASNTAGAPPNGSSRSNCINHVRVESLNHASR
jgi:hypothetical protein